MSTGVLSCYQRRMRQLQRRHLRRILRDDQLHAMRGGEVYGTGGTMGMHSMRPRKIHARCRCDRMRRVPVAQRVQGRGGVSMRCMHTNGLLFEIRVIVVRYMPGYGDIPCESSRHGVLDVCRRYHDHRVVHDDIMRRSVCSRIRRRGVCTLWNGIVRKHHRDDSVHAMLGGIVCDYQAAVDVRAVRPGYL